MGFPALATTSSGFAASLGRRAHAVSRDELVRHVASICAAVSVPVSVDSELLFPDAPGGITETVRLLAAAGAAGCSLEDHDPVGEMALPLEEAAARVTRAAAACAAHDLVLTARCESHRFPAPDLDDTVTRLRAYAAAGADVVFAPGIVDPREVKRLVGECERPVNVLALTGAPSMAELAALGVRRVSTGGALAFAAFGALADAAVELRDAGSTSYLARMLDPDLRARAFPEA